MPNQRLSHQMRHVLRLANAGRELSDGCHGQSEYGGRHCTIMSLIRRGLLTPDHQITEAGREVLNQERQAAHA